MPSPVKKTDENLKEIKYSFPAKKAAKNVPGKALKVQNLKTKSKLFSNTVVYLDCKGRKESSNLEAELKSLGAVIAVFLDRSVKLVVSDRVESTSCAPQSFHSPAASISPRVSCSPSTSERSPVPRSRGAAMLERASGFSNASFADPINLAVQWRIPIISAVDAWSEVLKHKLSKNRKSLNASGSKGKGHFIKIESAEGHWRPDLLKIERWPVLDLDAAGDQSPFVWDIGHGLKTNDRKEKTLKEMFIFN